MQIVDCGPNQYIISDGAFVAASNGVDLKVRTQNIGNALFAQSGGGPGFLDLLRERLLLLSEGWSRLHLHEQEVRRLLAAKERLLRDLEQRRTRTTDPGRTGVQ